MPDFEVLRPSLLDGEVNGVSKTWVVQEWQNGLPYSSRLSCTGENQLLEDALHAFTHFSYNKSNYEQLHHKFQGMLLSSYLFWFLELTSRQDTSTVAPFTFTTATLILPAKHAIFWVVVGLRQSVTSCKPKFAIIFVLKWDFDSIGFYDSGPTRISRYHV